MDIAHCYLEGNVDAVEFCPHESFHRVLAASTYTLQEGVQPNRSGSISLFSVDVDVGQLELFHQVDTSGIFDIKWNPVGANNMGPLLAQADASGYLRLHSLECGSNGSETGVGVLKEVGGEMVSSSMCLCLDWNASATSISVGLSDGSISLLTLTEAQLKIQQTWEAHEFEVWATTFDTHQPHLVYTGSDDCKFSCWDLRESPSKLAFQNTKIHKMGVCCITKHHTDPNTLLTGSYDEHLRIWDVRSIAKPVNESSICLGGGVWRIKQHPSIPDLILAACMHNGFAVVRIKGEKAEVAESYSKHNSLAYGADWQRGRLCKKDGIERPVVATCSFYDRLLRIWLPESEVVT
ncbi:WD40 repeat [Macleaya cordata]|uniref:methylated diphthine methylhydrolase n=1 Tax=Macleaya cordata TaxID=56857 RepID=A0A200RAX0_MACCD|nr:WD40 repeat [Macleaya cordata]